MADPVNFQHMFDRAQIVEHLIQKHVVEEAPHRLFKAAQKKVKKERERVQKIKLAETDTLRVTKKGERKQKKQKKTDTQRKSAANDPDSANHDEGEDDIHHIDIRA